MRREAPVPERPGSERETQNRGMMQEFLTERILLSRTTSTLVVRVTFSFARATAGRTTHETTRECVSLMQSPLTGKTRIV